MIPLFYFYIIVIIYYMKNINLYIIEKLRIDNFTKVSHDLKRGEHMSLMWIEDFEDEDTGEVIPFLRLGPDAFIFKEVDDDSFILYDYNDKHGKSDETEVYKNSNGYYQDKSIAKVFLSNEDMIIFLEEILRLGEDEEDDLLKFLCNYFDKDSIYNENTKKGIALAWGNRIETIKKTLKSLKRKQKQNEILK